MPDPGSLPEMERVDASRRRPVLVVVGLALLIGLLLWKPWDQPLSAPTLSPVALLPTTSPTAEAASSPTPEPSGSPTPEPPISPTPIDVASMLILDSALVRCEYTPRVGRERLLAGLVVVPPRLEPQPDIADSDVVEVSWRAEVQRNQLDAIFSAAWEQVALSEPQVSPAIPSPFVAFLPIHLDYEEGPSRAPSVLRVMVIVEWFGPQRTLLGTHSFVLTTYEPGESGPPRVEGCHTETAA